MSAVLSRCVYPVRVTYGSHLPFPWFYFSVLTHFSCWRDKRCFVKRSLQIWPLPNFQRTRNCSSCSLWGNARRTFESQKNARRSYRQNRELRVCSRL